MVKKENASIAADIGTREVKGDTTTLEDYAVLVKLSSEGKDEDELLGTKA